jgi:hypothetical protein
LLTREREREREQERDSNHRLLQHKHEELKKKIMHTRERDERERTHKITPKNNKNAKSEENPQIPTQFNKISYKNRYLLFFTH